MLKGLKVCVIIYSIALVVTGILNIIIPEQMAKLLGFSELSNAGMTLAMLLGAVYAAMGVWAIAASGDLAKNLTWVKFFITKALVSDVTMLYAVIKGHATFNGTWWFIAVDVLFVALFLAFYPWRATQQSAVTMKT